MQKTKIIATLGPVSESVDMLVKMINAGMDVARLNLSHGTHAHHFKLIKNIRQAAAKTKRPIPIILDLQGMKLRTGKIFGSGIPVEEGQTIVLFPEDAKLPEESEAVFVPIQLPDLYKYAKKGQIIYVDDAEIELEVARISGKMIECSVKNNGSIKSHKGLNLPGVDIKCPALSAKDLIDIDFGIKNNVDFIALSYVGDGADIEELRQIILKLEKKYGHKSPDFKKPKEAGKWPGVHTRIIAKIERPKAVKNFNKILEATDAVMVARGDLGMEMPLENLPLVQKEIIKKCLAAAKPVIVATQMLNSMIEKPYPTRAEVSDIANAILDGADAIMLSGETTTGKYPIKSIEIMDRIAKTIEPEEEKMINEFNDGKYRSLTSAIADECQQLAEKIGAKIIVCTSSSGYTARFISSHKPEQLIISLSPHEKICRQLNMSWGIMPFHFKKAASFDVFISQMKKFIARNKLAAKGEAIVFITGHPLGYMGETNLIKVERV